MNKVELLIVEGKSAHSNLAKACNKSCHAVHAIQGKLLNVSKHPRSAVVADLECQQLIDRLGCGFDETVDINTLPFSNVSILMDPDIDGAHSSALLLSFFNQFYRPLVSAGLLSLIKLPMFRVGEAGPQATFAWSPEELDAMCKSDVTRFKGVAQYSQAECQQFMLDADTRRQFLLT